MSETKATAGDLQAMFSRPKKYYENVSSGTVLISTEPTEMVYIRACSNCEFRATTKLAKCIIESCSNMKVAFEETIMSGTLEMIDSRNVSIFINPRESLPTVSVECCQALHLHYIRPHAFGSVYTVQSTDIHVHFKPPYKKEFVLELPEEESGDQQFMTSLSGESMVTKRVIREGAGYAKTPSSASNRAPQRSQPKVTTAASPSSNPAPQRSQPEVNTAASPSSNPAPQRSQPEVNTVASSSSASTQAGRGATGLREEEDSESTGGAKEPSRGVTKEEEEEDTAMAIALREKRRGLKPTETVERHLPVVGTGRGSGGGGGGGGRGFNPAIDSEDEKREFFDSPEQLSRKVEQTVKWIESSRHVIVFTGAGISTSCGIPDFRSGMNTVLETGPGVWELQAQDKAPPKASRSVPLIKALPSPTHMSIVKLQSEGVVQFTVSQNVDGLHRRSGLSPAQLSELHGNTNLETCRKCQRQYLRDFETREAYHVYDHSTSRKCDDPKCRGVLDDSIINFGESLPEGEVKKAFMHAKKADLCIVLGSSLRVSPANHVPQEVLDHGGRVVLCNLQRIPHLPADNRTLPVFCKCDQFMQAVMERLELQIPGFVLRRRVQIFLKEEEGPQGDKGIVVSATGLDVDENVPYSFVRGLSVECNGKVYSSSQEPLSVTLPPPTPSPLPLTLSFHGHYGEPPLQLQYPVTPGNRVYNLRYNISEGTWQVEEAK